MTNSPNSGQQPEPRPNRRWRRTVLQVSLVMAGLTFVAGAAGAWWVWIFIQQRLSPLVAHNLSQTLNRPLQLGAVERVTLGGLRFGASALPPTPTDRDRVTLDAVEVKFDLFKVLWSRRIGLNVTLIHPDIFVDQTPDGRWISTQITTQSGRSPIKTDLDTIRVEDATITLSPSPRVSARAKEPNAAATPPVIVARGVNGSAILTDNNQHIAFRGSGQPDHGGKFKLQGETLRGPDRTTVTIQAENILAADVSALLPLPLNLQAGRGGGNLTIVYQPKQPLSINGVATFQNVTAQIAQIPNRFSQAKGTLRFRNQLIGLEDVSGRYGQVPATAEGSIDLKKGYNLTAQVRSVRVLDLLQTFNLKTPIVLQGLLNADLRVTGALNQPLITGNASNASLLRADRIDISRLLAQFSVTPRALTFGSIEAIPVAGGIVTGNGQVIFAAPGRLAFNFQAQDVSGDPIARAYGATNANLVVGRVNARAEVRGSFRSFQTQVQWQAPQAAYATQRIAGRGQILVAGGNILFRNTELLVAGGTVRASGAVINGRWQALAQASEIALNRFSSKLPGLLNGNFRLSGTLDNLNLNGILAEGQVVLSEVAGGTVRGRAQVANGRWQALIQASEIALNQFSANLRGLANGDARLSGTLANLNPRAIRAQGQVRLSRGLAQLDRPLVASMRWLGDRLQIDRATAPGFSANGFVLAEFEGAPGIAGFDLNVILQRYDLATVPIALPNNIQVAGLASFQGQVRGTPAVPNLAGQLQLNNLVVNNSLAFEPVLAGDVQYVGGQGLNLNLTGSRDRIAARLDGRNRPLSFFVQQSDTIAQGTTQGDRLVATVQNFPLASLNLRPAARYGIGAVGGQLNGNFSVNLATLATEGNVAIAQPTLGYINAARGASQQADSLTAQFSYANGSAVVSRGELRFNSSRYLLAGSFIAGTDPQFRGKVTADQGRLEDLLAALQYFDIQDFSRGLQTPTYGRANTLNAASAGLSNTTLLTQLRRLSEILALQIQTQARAASNPIPDLSTLKGGFNADISFAGSARSGIATDFALRGQDWQWGDYGVSLVQLVDGHFENGILTVLPFRLEGLSYVRRNGQREQIANSFLNFSGQIGGAQQSGQLQASNLPVGLLRDLFRAPVNVEGQLNATATLSGSFTNPQATGEINLTGASLNNTPVQQATSFFSYNDARLNFRGRLVVAEPQPLTLRGSIPYRLPFMTVYPDSDALSLDINVKNEGIALLNLFQNQVVWKDGQGDVQLQVRGTVLQPQVIGTASIDNATFTAQALPEPLTNVSARVQFDRTRIQVESFQGQFNTGQVTAQGILPIFSANENIESPLTIALNDLVLNFKGLYNGGVGGRVVVTGAALAPRIGGNIILSDGRVSLPSNSAPSNSTVTPTTPTATPTNTDTGSITSPPELDNLQITLGDRVLITSAPVLNFVATGDLSINGPLGALQPKGTIRLRSGQVNLFTTQFNLDRRYEQTAVFQPNNGLNPYLDVQLVTSVPEVTRAPIQAAVPYASSEVAYLPATDFGALQTVRIRARVTGLASELSQNLELTSSPPRTESEILGLIGGGFVDTLGRGNGTLALANLAGSALLTSVQNVIGNTLGLSDFRLFPTTITDARGTSNFGLAAEVAFDITPNLSASVLQILTSAEPTQIGLRYRFNSELILRTSTNLSGETRAVLEFEQRF
jgi:translocation and assembly module TamB